jgi:hypothetical protein
VPEYFVVSDCTLEFSYSAKARKMPSDPLELPGEFMALEDLEMSVLSFDPETRMFSMAMCDPYDSNSAAMNCNDAAYFFTYEVAVVATLNDGAATFDDSLRFMVTYGPDCSEDNLAFD